MLPSPLRAGRGSSQAASFSIRGSLEPVARGASPAGPSGIAGTSTAPKSGTPSASGVSCLNGSPVSAQGWNQPWPHLAQLMSRPCGERASSATR